MATTQLSDLYNPLVFDAEVDENFIELNAFLDSGVVVPYEKLTAMANVGGMIGEMPFIKPLDVSGEPDYTDDDPLHLSTPDKITSGKQIYRLAKLHKSWSTMDFATELTLRELDPLAAITRKVGKYWAIQEEKRVIQASLGILADNLANDSGDMVVDIYADIAVPLEANIISAEAIQDSKQTSGDHQMIYTAIAMHSVTFNTLNKKQLIDFIPNARGEINFPTYLGLRVVMDDSLPVISGTNAPAYITMLFGMAAFGYGEGQAEVPSEMDRIAAAGYGSGENIIHTRKNPLIHPAGMQFTSASVVAETATLAELTSSANWDRVMDRKLIRIAFLKHNN